MEFRPVGALVTRNQVNSSCLQIETEVHQPTVSEWMCGPSQVPRVLLPKLRNTPHVTSTTLLSVSVQREKSRVRRKSFLGSSEPTEAPGGFNADDECATPLLRAARVGIVGVGRGREETSCALCAASIAVRPRQGFLKSDAAFA